MLRNGRESPLARYALQSIPGGAASAALRDALDDLEGELLVGVINSIAERRDAQALDALKPLAGSADDAVAFASIAALGRLGTPAASDVLLGLTSGDLEGEKWDAVADALLVCADELQPREPHRAARLYWVVLTRAKTENQLMAAVRGRVECEGPAGVPMVVELLGREDETLQGFALELVRSVRQARSRRGAPPCAARRCGRSARSATAPRSQDWPASPPRPMSRTRRSPARASGGCARTTPTPASPGRSPWPGLTFASS
jgi:hypothetical protein